MYSESGSPLEHETSFELAADLIAQRVPEGKRLVRAEVWRKAWPKAREVRIGNAMAHDQLAAPRIEQVVE